jgi:large subunit ribosomal protein L6
MSRVGNKPVDVPDGVKVEHSGRRIKISGTLGALEFDCPVQIKVAVEAGRVVVANDNPGDRASRELHGTTRTIIANMVAGVSKGFEKKMELYGTGCSVSEKSGKLVLQVGFCHPVERVIPKGLTVKIGTAATRGNDVPATFTISGFDKCLLGQFAADLRKVKPPEPYKGKGVRYADERVRRKAGKAFTSGAA